MAKNSFEKTRLDYDNWFDTLTDQYEIPAAERGAMQEVLKRINRNMRKPTAIPLNQFAACLCADKRTSKKWLDGFIEKGWLKINAKGEYSVNLNPERSDINESADSRIDKPDGGTGIKTPADIREFTTPSLGRRKPKVLQLA